MLYLQLLANDSGGTIKGYPEDPMWAGWIPIQSVQLGKNPARGGTMGGGAAPQHGDPHEAYLVAKAGDLDTAVLLRWATDAVPCRGVLNYEPPEVNQEGTRWSFTDVLVLEVQVNGMSISFALNFSKMEMQSSLRFR